MFYVYSKNILNVMLNILTVVSNLYGEKYEQNEHCGYWPWR